MTVDDDSSIYVGGLPYDVTDDSLRRVFDIYGAVIAVKIINERSTGGKCYGFVTFSNPRSATQAIQEMDGKTIDGRVVKVNDVRTRGRANFNNKSSRRDFERVTDNGGSNRGRDANYDRHHHRDGHRERSLEHEKESERGYDRAKDRYIDEDRFRGHNRHMGDVELGRERKRQCDWERDDDHNIEEQRNNSHHKSGDNDKQFLNRHNDHGSREDSLESFDDDQDQVDSKLALSNQKLEELREKISQMEDWTTDKEEEVSQLQQKYQKLEDSLKTAKKLTSHCQMQLQKLHKCYLQLRDYDKRIKNSEAELQSLVDATSMELEMEGPVTDAVLTNGRA